MPRLPPIACVVCAAVVVVAAAEPRLRPVAAPSVTPEQRALADAYSGVFGGGHDLQTLLVHPELVKGVLPFANYILAESTLTARHRELLILRVASLTRSDYLWAKHEVRARTAGISRRDIERAATRRALEKADGFDDLLLGAADELHEYSFISDDTWLALSRQYNLHQLMDATFTVAEMTMIAEVLNSAGVELQPGWRAVVGKPVSTQGLDRDRLPISNSRFAITPPTRPRIDAVELPAAPPDVRSMLDPSGSGRDVAAVYRTFARHPKLYVPRQILSEYIRTKSTLSPRVREMLILRIGWRCRSAYEWAAHAPAGRRAGLTDDQIRMLAADGYDGWSSADGAIVRAVDELFTTDTITDATWKELDDQFDERQLLDVLITTGGYRMVSMALNTFGVPAEPNSEPFP
jgi:4-carboxymuconolactone decarboxylase